MRRFFHRLLRTRTFWCSFVGWIALSTISASPAAMARWNPEAAVPWGLASTSDVLLYEAQLLLLVGSLTGIAAALATAPINGGARARANAIAAVLCASLGAWVVYWVIVYLPLVMQSATFPTHWQPPLNAQGLAYLLIFDWGVLVVLVIGAGLGALSGVLGWALARLLRRLQRTHFADTAD